MLAPGLRSVMATTTALGDTPARVFPSGTWARKQAHEVGLDVDKLSDFSRFVGGRGCVVRHGYLVHTWGDIGRRSDVASAAKPFYSHFLFKAVELGKIGGLDEKVARWEPRLGGRKRTPDRKQPARGSEAKRRGMLQDRRRINEHLGHPDAEITWRHLANQTSCYQLVERPGTAFAYNDWQMALLWDTLFLRVYRATYATVDAKVFRPLLTDKLGCQDRPTMMAFGTRDRPGRVAISVRDFARFGLLYLRQGNWNGVRLIGRHHARMAVSDPVPNRVPRAGYREAAMIPGQRSIGSKARLDNPTDHFRSYSWLSWINGTYGEGNRFWPDAPVDTYGAFGHGGPRAMWSCRVTIWRSPTMMPLCMGGRAATMRRRTRP